MTGDKTLLKEVQMGKGGRITYGDGSQSKVIGKGIIDIPGFRTSQEDLYVEGIKAYLLSVSQFCDNDLVVQFSKKECNIFDSSVKWLMGGGGKELLTTAMVFLVLLQILKFFLQQGNHR
jgi:hypothetical protein